MDVSALLAAGLIGYLLGSIPFGLILTRIAGLGDVRAIGSGNIGATNVLRTGRWDVAIGTLACDVGKGTVAVLAGAAIGPAPALAAGAAAILGHLFPLWLGFRGGKGVATFLGLLFGFYWPAAIVFGLLWLAVALLSRYSSLAALTATLASPIALLLFRQDAVAALMAALAAIVWLRHSANIRRLLWRTEGRIGERG